MPHSSPVLHLTTGYNLPFVEDQTASLDCISLAGNPAPTMSFSFVTLSNISIDFSTLLTAPFITKGQKGQRWTATLLRANPFEDTAARLEWVARAEDDGQQVTCVTRAYSWSQHFLRVLDANISLVVHCIPPLFSDFSSVTSDAS